MEIIKFKNNDNIIEATLLPVKEGVVKLIFTSIPEKSIYLSGFNLLNEHNYAIMGDYASYTTEYKITDEENTCYISTGEVYVEPVIPEPEPIPEPTEEELAAQKLAEFKMEKENKIYEVRDACETTIKNGITTSDGKKYSYTVQDQSNILNAMNLAKATGLEVPYHADGESCSLYTYDDIASIYMQEQMNLTKNQTYFNQLKLYIESVTDVKDIDLIKNIYYGTDLTGKYLDKYNEIMAQSEKVIQKLVSTN